MAFYHPGCERGRHARGVARPVDAHELVAASFALSRGGRAGCA